MDDSPFNSSYFWSPVPTVQGQVETNLLLELSWNTHGIVVCAMSKATQKGSPVWLSGPYVKSYMSDSDLTLFILLLTLSDNARLTSHRSCVNVSADVCESLSDNISVSPLNILHLTWLLSFLTFFSLHHTTSSVQTHSPFDSYSSPTTLCLAFCAAIFPVLGTFSTFFPLTVLTSPFLIFILQSGDTPFSLPHLIFTCHHFEMAHPPYCFVTSCLSFPCSYHQTAPLLIIT